MPDYARCITDYWAGEPGELTCHNNEILEIIRKEGRKQVYAENLFTGEKGFLPTYCFTLVELPVAAKHVFFAWDDFVGTEAGDLSFTKGAVIVGDKAVDDSWWSGWVGRNYGIFPVQWVRQFPSKNNPGEYPKIALVSFDFHSPISGELSVRTGETITIVEKRSDGWFEAISATGIRGVVPGYCVDLAATETVPEKKTVTDIVSEKEFPQTTEFSSNKATETTKTVVANANGQLNLSCPHARALYEFDSGVAGELKLRPGDVIFLSRVVDENWLEGQLADGQSGIFPSAFVEVIVALSEPMPECLTDWVPERLSECLPESSTVQYTDTDSSLMEDFPPFTYAIVITSYTAKTADELSLQDGDTVTILSKRGMHWIEAMDDFGNVGFCPTFCLEIIGSEPDEVRSASQLDNLSVSSFDSFKPSDGSVSPTLSGEATPTAQIKNSSKNKNKNNENNENKNNNYDNNYNNSSKRGSWYSDDRQDYQQGYQQTSSELGSRVGLSESGSRGSLPFRQPKRNLKADDRRQTDMETREKVVQEIIVTEKDYLEGLKVCLSVMNGGSLPPKEFQLSGAVQQLDGVLRCSDSLLHDLRAADVTDGQIGECFLRHITSLRGAYVTYCQNSDMTIEALAKYKDVPELSMYMERKVADIRQAGVNCFDLAGMFIKPLQRILKYPLLMAELLKVTGSQHSDHVFVVDSLKQLTEIAVCINELKRRKELVLKYRSLGSSASFAERWTDRLSRISFHSLAKKSSRLSLLVSSTMGFTTLIQDPTFQTEERKFQVSKRTIKWFLRSVGDFLEQARIVETLLVALADDHTALTSSSPSDSISAFAKTQTNVASHIRDEFIPKIDLHVIQPLEQVLKQYQGPSNLISKRHAKLIDFENAKRKVERAKTDLRTQTMLDELELAKKVYQALNAQLLEDLPTFNQVICRILQSRIEAFLHFRKICFHVCADEMATCFSTESGKVLSQKVKEALTDLKKLDFGACVSLPLLSGSTQTHSDSGALRGNLRKISAPPGGTAVNQSALPRSSSMRLPVSSPTPPTAVVVPDRYRVVPIEDRYRVVADYRPVESMDLSAHRGDVVEVVKRRDPMGRDDKWFVRLNGQQGFLPKEILSPATSTNTGTGTGTDTDTFTSTVTDSGYRPPVPVRVSVPVRVPETTVRSAVPAGDVRIAGFAFVPGGPYQLPLTAGDEVSVLSQHDLEGNSEWWYVQNRYGTRGYVPGAYLRKPD